MVENESLKPVIHPQHAPENYSTNKKVTKLTHLYKSYKK